MTASSAVVLSNLAYLIGAVVLATIGGLIVWWRHRRPQSIYSNVESFHRGLQALAPDSKHAGSNGIRPAAVSGLRIQPEPVAAAATDPAPDPTAAATNPAPDPGPAADTAAPAPLAAAMGPAANPAPAGDAAPPDPLAPGPVPGPVYPPTAELEAIVALPVGTNGNGSHHPAHPEPAADDLDGRIPDLLDGVMGPPPVSLDLLDGAVDDPPVGPGAPEPAFLPTPAFPPNVDEAGSESRVAGRAGVEAG